MKRILSLVLVVFALTAMLASCAANEQKPADTTAAVTTAAPADITKAPEKVATLILGTDPQTEYSVDLSKVEITEGLMSVLNYLKDTQGLAVVSDDAGYGAYLTQVGEIRQDAANGEYVYLWTSVEKDFDVSQYATTMEYNGKTLTSSGVGASEMTVEEGAVIYIGTVKY